MIDPSSSPSEGIARVSNAREATQTIDPLVRTVLEDTLAYARSQDYRGWDYGDGMSSWFLRAVPLSHPLLNLAVQETVKQAPVNLRPLFRVEQRRNFKGIALFAIANIAAAEQFGSGQLAPEESDTEEGQVGADAGRNDPDYAAEARSLVDWLVDHRVESASGFAGCHRHDIQTLDGVVPAGTPGVVGTAYGVDALLRAAAFFDHDPYADLARTAADFVFEDLNYRPANTGALIDYKPGEPDGYTTINAVALGARLLLALYQRFGEPRFRSSATALLTYVADLQTDAGGWHYREPPETSHLSMDNHHNGFVIEAFQRYDDVVGDGRFGDTLRDGLLFYRNTLFESTGAPNFDESSAYPRDVHAAAQGIIVFAAAGNRGFARRILEWTIEHLYLGAGRFLFRRHRFHTKRHVLMRWCVAWMAYALGAYEAADVEGESPSLPPL